MTVEKQIFTWDEIQTMFPASAEGRNRAAHEREVYLASYNLKQIRKLRDVTQVSLAGFLKISQNRISQIERGKLDAAQLGTLERYVAALGGQLTVSAKFGDETYILSQTK